MNKTQNHVLLSIKNSKKIINLTGKSKIYSIQLSQIIGTNYPIIKKIAVDELGFQLGNDFYTFIWTDNPLTIK